MVKTLNRSRRQERVKFKVPRSVQQAIPIRRIWPDGIFQVGNQFSKSFSFTDINYAIAGKGKKKPETVSAYRLSFGNERIDRKAAYSLQFAEKQPEHPCRGMSNER